MYLQLNDVIIEKNCLNDVINTENALHDVIISAL